MIPEIGHFALILALSLALLQGVLPMVSGTQLVAIVALATRNKWSLA